MPRPLAWVTALALSGAFAVSVGLGASSLPSFVPPVLGPPDTLSRYVLAVGAGWTAAALVFAACLATGRLVLPAAPHILLALSWSAWAAFAGLHSVLPAQSRLLLPGALLPPVLILAGAQLGEEGVALLLGGLSLSLAGAAGLGLWQLVQSHPTPSAWVGLNVAAVLRTRATGPFPNPNFFGAAMVLGSGAALAWWERTRPGWARLLPGLAGALTALGLLASYSRGAYAGEAVLLAAVLAAPNPWPRRLRRLLPAALPLLAGIFLIPHVLLRLHTTSFAPGSTGHSRLFTWKTTVRVWRRQPWLGNGLGTLNALYSAARPLGHTGTVVTIALPGAADNDLLQALAEGGLIPVVPFLAAAALWSRRILRRRAQLAPLLPLAGAVAGVAVQGMVEVTLPLVSQGMGAALLLSALATGDAEGQVVARGARARVLALPLLLVLALPARMLPPAAAVDRLLLRLPSGPAGVPALRRASRLVPGLPSLAARLAGLDLTVGLYGPPRSRRAALARAQQDIAAARRLDPWSPVPYADEALLLSARGNRQGALRAALQALRRDPYNPFLALQVAQGAARLGLATLARQNSGFAVRMFGVLEEVYIRRRATSTVALLTRQQQLARRLWRAEGGRGPLPVRPAWPSGSSALSPR